MLRYLRGIQIVLQTFLCALRSMAHMSPCGIREQAE